MCYFAGAEPGGRGLRREGGKERREFFFFRSQGEHLPQPCSVAPLPVGRVAYSSSLLGRKFTSAMVPPCPACITEAYKTVWMITQQN